MEDGKIEYNETVIENIGLTDCARNMVQRWMLALWLPLLLLENINHIYCFTTAGQCDVYDTVNVYIVYIFVRHIVGC